MAIQKHLPFKAEPIRQAVRGPVSRFDLQFRISMASLMTAMVRMTKAHSSCKFFSIRKIKGAGIPIGNFTHHIARRIDLAPGHLRKPASPRTAPFPGLFEGPAEGVAAPYPITNTRLFFGAFIILSFSISAWPISLANQDRSNPHFTFLNTIQELHPPKPKAFFNRNSCLCLLHPRIRNPSQSSDPGYN